MTYPQRGVQEGQSSVYVNGNSQSANFNAPPQWSSNTSSTDLDPSLQTNQNATRVMPGSLTLASKKMVTIADSISIANAQGASAMTKIPPPGADSVSALSARFFNARGDLYRVHTDRGADIGKRLSWSLEEAAKKYQRAESDNNESFGKIQ
ncbi:PE family protein [Mycobacterium haemophilum]|uniref:PE family protein n=1 Tax=Mycobacterium haemophilum TaxID=29311 RepID=UPI000A66D2D9|nr:PE family protein [Mycobacterium haemophilum]MCV7342001.1 PE family protein [Mycobacterium haemophilum DSM 44634]